MYQKYIKGYSQVFYPARTSTHPCYIGPSMFNSKHRHLNHAELPL